MYVTRRNPLPREIQRFQQVKGINTRLFGCHIADTLLTGACMLIFGRYHRLTEVFGVRTRWSGRADQTQNKSCHILNLFLN